AAWIAAARATQAGTSPHPVDAPVARADRAVELLERAIDSLPPRVPFDFGWPMPPRVLAAPLPERAFAWTLSGPTTSPVVALRLAQAYASSAAPDPDHLLRAVGFLKDALSRDPGCLEADLALGLVRMQASDLDHADAAYRAVLEDPR